MTSRKFFAIVLMLSVLAGFAFAEEAAAPKAEAAAVPAETQLIKLVDMQQAFLRTFQKRQLLANTILADEAKAKTLQGDEAKKLQTQIDANRKGLATLVNYMDVVFGLSNTREYEFNPITSTIYLRVGNVTECFIRAIALRDALRKQAVTLKAQLDKAPDEAAKAHYQGLYDSAIARLTLVSNALFNVYEIHPKRNYSFDPDTNTLYLKATEEEVAKLKADLEKQQQAAPKDK